MTKKKWLLILIIAFPSFFWLILETSKINSRKLPIYGPKILSSGKDTIYYQVDDRFLPQIDSEEKEALVAKDFPLYAAVFVSSKYRGDAYRLTGLWEYLNYKKDKISHIPFVLVTEVEDGQSIAYKELKELSESPNVHFYFYKKSEFENLSKNYFKEKPYYIDYSYFVLIDANRQIRGYYDARYVSEIKRLIGEYQHLRLKEEKQLLINENEIKKEN